MIPICRLLSAAAMICASLKQEIPTGEVSPNLHHVAQHYDDLPALTLALPVRFKLMASVLRIPNEDFMMFIHVDVYEHVEVPALVSVLNSFALRSEK